MSIVSGELYSAISTAVAGVAGLLAVVLAERAK